MATSFNSDISKWDVSKVNSMLQMFYEAKAFKADISEWDVSKVANMQGMFIRATSFNSDISKWDVSKVTVMNMMFYQASSFSQTLCGHWRDSKSIHIFTFDGSEGRVGECPCGTCHDTLPTSAMSRRNGDT